MFKGFYNLTSGMLSQGRRLDVIANNMTNVSTAGYKSEHYTDSTFNDVMISRVGNLDKTRSEELGNQSYILAPDQLYIDYEQGSLEETNLPLDFAIQGEGFFAIETEDGIGYTRNGSFTLDNDGYLRLSGLGFVLDQEGNRILLGTDKVEVDKTGEITSINDNYLGRLGVFTFEDNEDLTLSDQGLFVDGGAAQVNPLAVIHHRWVERSNVNMVQEMVNMMTAQRALQSAAQMSKIYDQVITRATSELGRL